MKRNSPLRRNKPLEGGGQLKRTPLKPRSEKTQRRYDEERIPLVIATLRENPLCEICWRRKSTDCHEKRSRGRTGGVHGDAWLDPDNIMALCRRCHDWVTTHPEEAEELGFLLPSTN